MRSSSLPWVFAALVALPVAGETRVRVENISDPSSRVTIGFAEQAGKPARVEVGANGVAELVVEAPSPRLRLRGGTLQTDPMIDLIARRQIREESGAPALHIVRSGDAPAQFAPFDGPLVYDDYAGWWGGGAWTGGWYGSYGGSRRFDSGVGRRFDSGGGRRTGGGDWRSTHAPRTPQSGGSFKARGVVPRTSR